MELDSSVVIDFFKSELENNTYSSFIKSAVKDQLILDLEHLKSIVEHPEQQDYFHNLIQTCSLVWKELFISALCKIDSNVNGMSDLISYFDKFVDFEEILYSSDDFYRDHTSHTLWTYFLAEMFLKKLKEINFIKKPKEFPKGSRDSYIKYEQYLQDNAIDTIYNGYFDDSRDLTYPQKFEEILNKIKNDSNLEHLEILREDETFVDFDLDFIIPNRKIYLETLKIKNNMPAIRCVAFLCHDLGYPLKRIKKISKKVSDILEEFNAKRMTEYGFIFSGGIRDFLLEIVDLISRKYVIREKNLTFERDQQLYMNLLLDSENYEHGLMSAFILSQKIHSILSDITNVSSKIHVNNVEIANSLSKTLILKAISMHTCVNKRIIDLRDLEDLIIFIDFIEEFSRMTRASMVGSRMPQFCKTDLLIEYIDETLTLNLVYKFDPEGNRIQELDPKKTFIDKVLFIQQHFNFNNNIKFQLTVIDPIKNSTGIIQRNLSVVFQDGTFNYSYSGYTNTTSVKKKIEKKIKKNQPEKALEFARERKNKKTTGS